MPPKVKITKEDIVNAAVDIIRIYGVSAVNARTVAANLNCSTQPVFSNFATMEQLHLAVIEKAQEIYNAYTQREIESGKYPAYKATGMAYIRFAKEEKELFKLLFMCERTQEQSLEDTELFERMMTLVQENTGLSGTNAKLFHLEIWAYVHGIAAMFATGFLNLDWELVSATITDIYQGLRKHHTME